MERKQACLRQIFMNQRKQEISGTNKPEYNHLHHRLPYNFRVIL